MQEGFNGVATDICQAVDLQREAGNKNVSCWSRRDVTGTNLGRPSFSFPGGKRRVVGMRMQISGRGQIPLPMSQEIIPLKSVGKQQTDIRKHWSVYGICFVVAASRLKCA
ncbi:MAG: hypothetical protein MK110_07035 [Fuerstiella sp.]|nr:hypothetical protein [Fuerstiella sp.]